MRRKLILYIASSLDGYIAKPNDDLSFLSVVEKVGEDYGYADFLSTVDTVILGRKTYDWVTKRTDFPHTDKITYVLTRTERPDIGKTVFYTRNMADLVRKLKNETGENIFCDGGAEIINELLRDNLIDEFIISVIPVLLGNGTRLFKDNRPELNVELVSAKTYDTGLIQLHYKRIE